MSVNNQDILIVGGGIIGMLTARELARSGASVRLLERGATGQESSWAGGGIISPLYPWRYEEPVTALAAWGQQYYPQLARELHAESGIDPELLPSGLLMLDVEDGATAQAWAETHQHPIETLNTEGLRELEPGLAQGNSGLWMPDVTQIRNPRMAQAARLSLQKLGVAVEEHAEVTGLLVESGRIQGVETVKGRYLAEKVVVASGAWSAELLARLMVPVEVEPVKGQMILYRAAPDAIRHIVLNQGKYIIPRRDGHVLTGSTLEFVGFEKSTTQDALLELRQAAEQMFPLLAECEVVNQWAGLRPGTPTGIPYIGEHPKVEGLYLNAGHFRNGVVLGPASARLMADLVLQRTPILAPEPYALDSVH